MDLVKRTWDELGYEVEATGYLVWVRTMPHPRKHGSIWLPPKAGSFHGELPHLRTVYATVLSAGPIGQARELKPGDIVGFKRLEFAWWAKMKPSQTDEYGGDEEFVGYIDSNYIAYVVEEADGIRVSKSTGQVVSNSAPVSASAAF